MLSKGSVKIESLGLNGEIIFWNGENYNEIWYIEGKKLISAYKVMDDKREFMYKKFIAKEIYNRIKASLNGCKVKDKVVEPLYIDMLCDRYDYKTKKEEKNLVYKHKGKLVSLRIEGNWGNISLYFSSRENGLNRKDPLKYVELSRLPKEFETVDNIDEIPPVVRKLEEIRLFKNIDWLDQKKYYVIQNAKEAEKVFRFLEKFDGPIGYDVETTGLKINMFSKVNSREQKIIKKYNEDNKENPIRVDKLVGIIFAFRKDEAFYFPCGHKYIQNLYEDKEDDFVKEVIKTVKNKARKRDPKNKTDIGRYLSTTHDKDVDCDVILMERARYILENKYIVAHNGSFEWKSTYCYDIILNLKEDTLLLHQMLYKYRVTSDRRGEPSNLKFLSWKYLGVNQLDLKDFFMDYSEDESGKIKGKGKKKVKKKKSNIDFSYMDYEGTKAYAPADGDLTLLLLEIFKKELLENHKGMEFLYNVEVVVACAIGYMEFYGHKIDEEKIEKTKIKIQDSKVMVESEIRQLVGYADSNEKEQYGKVTELFNRSEELTKELNKLDFSNSDIEKKELLEKEISSLSQQMHTETIELKKVMDNNNDNILNLASPQQVAKLFYDVIGIPTTEEDGRSVGKKIIKKFKKMKDESGKLMYPVVSMYSKWKELDTMNSKFFDSLPDFMYPGGYIFSSYGQITTATGRMSCIAEGTPIKLVGEDKAIEKVKIGDLVYCYDKEGNLRISKVVNVIDNGFKECVEVKWRSQGSHKLGNLVCTPDHKIRKANGEWVEAKNLKYKDKLTHLRTSEEQRPKLYGLNNLLEQEQLFIKKEYFKSDEYNTVIHHKDENTQNNKLNNLEIKSRSEHSRDHSLELIEKGVIKYEHLRNMYGNTKGNKHYKYIDVTLEQLENMIRDAQGIVVNVPMDFGTFKKKCKELNFDYTKVAKEYRTYYKSVSDDEFIESFFECKGIPYAISKKLGIGRTKVARTIERLNLCYNHKVESVKEIGVKHVYDLEIEDYHNFIASEICVHNCSKPNAQQYPKVISNIVIPRDFCVLIDSDYSQIEYRVMVALAKELGLIEMFSDVDVDYHTLMASLMFGVPYSKVTPKMRGDAKSFNFGIPYGMGFASLAKLLYDGNSSKANIEDAKIKYELYFKDQPRMRAFFNNIKEQAMVNGYTKTWYERERHYNFYKDGKEVSNDLKAAFLRQAGNAVIQGSAADIFKIAVARLYTYIKNENLFKKLYIINMIHDEVLLECNVELLNENKILADLAKCMEFKINTFPPLYIGAGIGKTWKAAKDKPAEIHPDLMKQIVKETKDESIYKREKDLTVDDLFELGKDNKEVLESFEKNKERLLEFRVNRVINYLNKDENKSKEIHPAIANLMANVLRMEYGLDEEDPLVVLKTLENIKSDYDVKAKLSDFNVPGIEIKDPMIIIKNLEEISKKESIDFKGWFRVKKEDLIKEPNLVINLVCKYIEEFKIDIKASDIIVDGLTTLKVEIEDEDVEYEDEDEIDEEEHDDMDEIINSEFEIIQEEKEYGVNIVDVIKTFGYYVSKSKKICAIDCSSISWKQNNQIQSYLEKYQVDDADEDSMQVAALTPSKGLIYSGIYVKNVNYKELDRIINNK